MSSSAPGTTPHYYVPQPSRHPASEHSESGGPALLDAAHWATEQPWLALAAAALVSSERTATVETFVSALVTDPWTRAVVPG